MNNRLLPPRSYFKNNGFAVIIVLLLATFILMLSVTLTLSVSASNSQVNAKINQLIAEKNSIFSLKVALGNLQKHAGPDQRITAPATILPSVTPSKEQMIGIWDTTNQDNIFWLSSDYQEGENNFLRQAAPTPESENAITLLGEGTLGERSEQLHVINNLSLIQSSDSNEDPTHRYAWWIDDEGLKAKITPRVEYDRRFDKYSSLLARQMPRQPSLTSILPNQTLDSQFNTQLAKLYTTDSLSIIGLDDENKAKSFESFSIWSKGVLSNVKDGGLKKDLSLAFEMDDNDFNRSEYASGGEDSIPVDGIRVQPIFVEREKNLGLDANGPAWHLLRDYYRLYHKIESPLRAPTLDAQTFLPNLGTPTLRLNGPFTNHDWGAITAMSFVVDSNDEINGTSRNALSKQTTQDPPAIGDPLVVTNGSNLPVLYQGSYLPYVQRAAYDFGIQFQDNTVDVLANDYIPYIYSRQSYVIHNPYNVNIRHQGLYSVTNRLMFRFTIRPSTNPPDNSGRANNTGSNNNALKVLPGELNPGEIKIYEGLPQGNTQESLPGVQTNWAFSNGGSVNRNTGRNVGFPQRTYTAFDNAESVINTHSPSNVLFFSIFNGIGFDQQPIDANLNRDNATFPKDARYYNGVRSDDIHPNYSGWFGNVLGDSFVSEPYAVSAFNNATGGVASIFFFDFRLAAAEDDFNFPAFSMNNPLAPILMNQNLFDAPSINDPKLNTSNGFPYYAPGWNIKMEQTNINGLTNIESNQSSGYWGNSYGSSSGKTNIGVIDLPTTPPLSLAKLQNANISVYGHMPYFAIGNSFASPFLDPQETITSFSNRDNQPRVFYDLSYLANEALWDDYFFSSYSIPYDAGSDDFNETRDKVEDSFNAAFVSRDQNGSDFIGSLPNSNMSLYKSNESLEQISEKLFDGGGDPRNDGYQRAAENLLVNGAFNIHSTSEDAWVALLSAAQGLDVYQEGSQSTINISDQLTPVGRLTQSLHDAFRSTNNKNNTNAWGGVRVLNENEIRTLAKNIIDAIQDRISSMGRPFMSLAEFINRELTRGSTGKSGVLQTAIDNSRINDPMTSTGLEVDSNDLNDSPSQILFPAPDNITTSAGNGRSAATGPATAAITQGDLLESIAASINVRSDTFTIRSYGDHIDPITRKVLAKAYCEAVVQRVPEPVQPSSRQNDPTEADFWEPEQVDFLGRRFKIISLRWLNESDI